MYCSKCGRKLTRRGDYLECPEWQGIRSLFTKSYYGHDVMYSREPPKYDTKTGQKLPAA